MDVTIGDACGRALWGTTRPDTAARKSEQLGANQSNSAQADTAQRMRTQHHVDAACATINRHQRAAKSLIVSSTFSPGRASIFLSATAVMRLRPSAKALSTRAALASRCNQKCCSKASRVTAHSRSRPRVDSWKITARPSAETLGSNSTISIAHLEKFVKPLVT